MTIPVVPVHVVTSKTLTEKLKAARAEGVAEGRNFANRQIEMLLGRRARKPIRLKNNNKKIKQKGV